MGQPLPDLPEQRQYGSGDAVKLPRLHVVLADGTIKGIPFERNIGSPLISQDWVIMQGRRVKLRALGVSLTAQEEGCVALYDLYVAEDRLEDWEAYLLWYAKANSGPHRMPQLSDEYLPDEVLRRRREAAENARKIVLPPPKRKRQAKAEEGEGKPAKVAKRKRTPRA